VLQDFCLTQELAFIGLLAHLTGVVLQDDISGITRHLRQLGQDVIGSNCLLKLDYRFYSAPATLRLSSILLSVPAGRWLQKNPLVETKRRCQLLGRLFPDNTFAVFHLADMVLRNAGQHGKLFLRQSFLTTSPSDADAVPNSSGEISSMVTEPDVSHCLLLMPPASVPL
jgi:hypothetical protein